MKTKVSLLVSSQAQLIYYFHNSLPAVLHITITVLCILIPEGYAHYHQSVHMIHNRGLRL